MVDAKTRQRIIIHNPGDMARLQDHEIDRGAVTSAGCVLIDPYEVDAAVRAASLAREASIPVLLHVDDMLDGVSRLVPMADFFIAPADHAREFARNRNLRKAIDYLLSFGPRVVMLITDQRGCICATRTERFEAPPFPGDLVDTTGAQDVFHGACALGVLRGWELKRIVEFAIAAMSMKCASLGSREGIPRLAEVERFLLHYRAKGF
jgi:sulfofructose kinase